MNYDPRAMPNPSCHCGAPLPCDLHPITETVQASERPLMPDWTTLDEADIRVLTFTDRPECLLIVATSDGAITLPRLRAPFVKHEVTRSLSEAGIRSRVSETQAGRWSRAAVKAHAAEKAERFQQNKQREATEATLLRGAESVAARDRAEAIASKHAVDETIRNLKAKIGEAKSKRATTGQHMDPHAFRRLERDLALAQTESLALQTRLGELKKAEKAENIRLANEQQSTFRGAFFAAAKRTLDRAVFLDLLAQAEAETLGHEDDGDA